MPSARIYSHRFITALLLLIIMIQGTVARADSIAAADTLPPLRPVRPWAGIAAGAGMLGVAAAARQAYPRDFAVQASGPRSDRMTDYLQYAPMVAPWIFKAAGAHTRSDWGRLAVSQGVAAAVMIGTVKGLKDAVGSTRPDGSGRGSFPSGHTAWAFMGATMVAYELGDISPWYAVGAYTLATGIAVERVLDRHHYSTDVMAGAGIGILSANVGYLISDRIFGNSQACITGRDLRQESYFSFMSLQTGLSLPLGPIRAGTTSIQRLPALSVSLRSGRNISEHWGLALEAGLLSTPLITDVHHDRPYVKPQTSLSIMAAPYYILSLSSRIRLTAEAAVGYRHNLALNLDDRSIDTGTSSPVGRVNVGCVLRLNEHFSTLASVGYEVSRYRYTVHPSSAYHIPAAASARGVSSALLVNISSRYEF